MVDRKENADMKIPKFKSEKEEADWSYAHRREIERDLDKAAKKGQSLTVAEIIGRETTKLISIHLAIGDIERAKAQAKAKGIGYQTWIRMLLHESLEKAS
jgi:predicted DNA binding CopG/RHH family protein